MERVDSMLTFGNIIRQNALKYGGKPAVIFNNTILTYVELNERSNQLANAFTSQGYQKGDKVSVLMKNNAVYVEIIIALSKIGVVIVPMNYRLVGTDIDYILEDSNS